MTANARHFVFFIPGQGFSTRKTAQLRRARVCLVALGMAIPVYATAADNLANCRSIPDSAQRLACYDALAKEPATPAPAAKSEPVQNVPGAASSAAPAGTASVATPSAPPPSISQSGTATQSFGAETVTKTIEQGPKRLVAHVVGTIDGVRRGAVFHLDNGQTWRSIDDREYDYAADHPTVTIDRNFAGNYWMHLEHGAFNLRVSRVE
jgi:hypothetical protein